jgi:apolipoprotein D and lipocalin family protein
MTMAGKMRAVTILRKGLAVGLAALVASCTGAPDGVTVVDDFQLERYLGTWHEIARLDHRFERGLTHVTANYSLRSDGGVKVVNRGFDSAGHRWKEAEGKAYFVGASDVGQLKVSFFGPFYGGYNVIALDREEYRYSLVAGPDRGYLWILSRTPELEPAITEQLVGIAREYGFPVEELIFVAQGDRPDEQIPP